MWNEHEKKPVAEYLLWAFGIAWGAELLLVLVERLNIFSPGVMKIIAMLVFIGPLAGLAPAYSCYIILKKSGRISGFKDFFRLITACKNKKRAALIWCAFAAFMLVRCILIEDYRNYPWFTAILFMPLMMVGGGLEEIGWRGFLQPALHERFGFFIGTVLMGLIWAAWHLPLWLVQSANQSSFSLPAFVVYCISISFSLGLLYKTTSCVLAACLFHAWANTTVGGIFTFNELTAMPTATGWVLIAAEILVCTAIASFIENKSKKTPLN